MVQLIIDYYFINDIHKNKNPKNQKLIIIACKKKSIKLFYVNEHYSKRNAKYMFI